MRWLPEQVRWWFRTPFRFAERKWLERELAAMECPVPGCTDRSGTPHNPGNARCHGCGSAHQLGGRYAQFWCPACAPPGHY